MSSIYRILESSARSRWATGRYKNGFITQYGPAGLLAGYNNQIVNDELKSHLFLVHFSVLFLAIFE